MVADVVDYTRHMAAGEDETHRRVVTLLRHTLRAVIEQHHGFIVKHTGDGLIASFTSIVSAIHCAVQMQRQVGSTPPLSSGEKIALRIGLHVGDVIVHNDEFYGDCVNVAARIETLAKPGGLCISSAVYEQVKGRIPYSFESIGKRPMKNVAAPPELFHLAELNGSSLIATQAQPLGPSIKLRSTSPIRPFVAVLPIEAPSSQPELCELARRLTRELCVNLQQYRWFGVRQLEGRLRGASSHPVLIDDAGPFAVYRVEGHVDVRPGGIRMVLQLCDTVTGVQVWAGVSQLRLADRANGQEWVTQQVAAKIEEMVQRSECERYARVNSADLDLYSFTQQAYWHYYHRSRTENDVALRQFNDVVRACPSYAPALAGKAACHFWAGQQHWDGEPHQALRQAYDAAKGAVAADPVLPWGRLVLAQSELFLGYHDAALASARQAVQLSPNSPANLSFLGHAMTAAGKFQPAIKMLRSALMLAPNHPNRFMWLSNLALAKYHARQLDGALAAATAAADLNPDHWLAKHVRLASLARLGYLDSAAAQGELWKVEPDSQAIINRLPYKRPADLEYVTQALSGPRTRSYHTNRISVAVT